jgi:hypothetical protein
MSTWIKLLFIAVSLSVLTLSVALAPPSHCVEEYAVIGGIPDPPPGVPLGVEGEGWVGTKAWCSTSTAPIELWLSPGLDPADPPNPDGEIYWGKVRILPKNGRFDFWFSSDDGSICDSVPENPCLYWLNVPWGVFDQRSNTVMWEPVPEQNEDNAWVQDLTTGEWITHEDVYFFAQLSEGPGDECLPLGESCESDDECCSGNCGGKPGKQTCK